MNNYIDTDELRRCVAANALDFAQWLFPHGRRIGSRCYVGDLSGNPGDSLSVELVGIFAGCFRDWASDERGDCIAATMAVRGLDFAGAIRVLRERYGVSGTTQPPKPRTRNEDKLRGPKLPPLQRGNLADLQRLAESRNLAPAALDLASERGLLWFYDSSDGRAWLITDRARRNAQARRLDGKPWEWMGRKAWTLGGSAASWPIGLPESEPFPAIALCEGTPDFLAAFHHALASDVAAHVAPVCMVGASHRIPSECLTAFAGKRVRVFVHDDAEGISAAKRWAAQLHGIALRVDGYIFDGLTRTDGAPLKDLCDLASIDADSWEANRDAVENCMAFAIEGRAA